MAAVVAAQRAMMALVSEGKFQANPRTRPQTARGASEVRAGGSGRGRGRGRGGAGVGEHSLAETRLKMSRPSSGSNSLMKVMTGLC
jgi:hypothetical protein